MSSESLIGSAHTHPSIPDYDFVTHNLLPSSLGSVFTNFTRCYPDTHASPRPASFGMPQGRSGALPRGCLLDRVDDSYFNVKSTVDGAWHYFDKNGKETESWGNRDIKEEFVGYNVEISIGIRLKGNN